MTQEQDQRPVAEWRDFLEQLTKAHEGDDITIEVMSRDFGDQEQAERLPLAYIEYDHKDDVAIVAVGGRSGRFPVVLRHIVEHPQKILADLPSPDSARALDIEGGDGSHTVVTLHPHAGEARSG